MLLSDGHIHELNPCGAQNNACKVITSPLTFQYFNIKHSFGCLTSNALSVSVIEQCENKKFVFVNSVEVVVKKRNQPVMGY